MPDTETEHDRNRGGEVGDGEDVAQQPGEDRAHPMPARAIPTGQAHGEHRPEGQDEHDDGERQAQQLGAGHLELGEDLATDLDLDALDVGHQLPQLG